MSEDRGSASLIAVALIVVLLAAGLGVVAIGSAVIARHRAQSAADLAALAAAGWLAAGHRSACAHASSVAAAMGTAVSDCRISGLDALVTVEATAGVRGWRAQARARAGPGSIGPVS